MNKIEKDVIIVKARTILTVLNVVKREPKIGRVERIKQFCCKTVFDSGSLLETVCANGLLTLGLYYLLL